MAWRWASSQAGTAFSISRLALAVSRNGWARASSSGTTSSQPLARIRSTLRLRVDASSCRISQTWPGRAEAEFGRHDQDVQLADLQAEGPQGVVVKCS